jgi:hypothetical protein
MGKSPKYDVFKDKRVVFAILKGIANLSMVIVMMKIGHPLLGFERFLSLFLGN